MATTIIYCDRCKERVPPRDIEGERVLTFQGQSYCGKCAEALRPTLEQDPAFQAEIDERAREAEAEKDATRRSVQGGSRIAQRRKKKGRKTTAGFAAPAQPRKGQSSRRGASGGPGASRSRDTAPAGQGIPPMAYAVGGLAGGVLIAAVVMFAMRADPPPAVVGSGSGSAVAPGSGSGSAETPIDHKRLTLEALRDRIARYDRDNPDEYNQLLERWRQFRLEAVDYPDLTRAAAARLEAVKDRLDRAGARHFEDLKERSRDLQDSGEWDEAAAIWDEFDERLKTKSWALKIDFERDNIKRAKAKWEREQAGKFTQGEIPSAGYMASIFNGRSLDRWEFMPDLAGRGGQAFKVRDGVIHIDHDGRGDRYAAPLIEKPQGGAMQLRDYYLGFDFKLERGSAVVAFRMPLNRKRLGGGEFTLSADGGRFERGRWYRAHMIVEGEVIKFWVVGALSLNTMRNKMRPQGRVMFGAHSGDHYQLRNLALRVLKEGDTYTPGEIPPLIPRPRDLLKDLQSAGKLPGARNVDNWTIADGVLKLVAGPKPGPSGFGGDLAKTMNYRLSFEARQLDGKLYITLRAPKGRKPAGLVLTPDDLGNDERWRAVSIDVDGSRAIVSIDGKRSARPVEVRYTSGPIGLNLDGQGCQIRKLVLTTME